MTTWNSEKEPLIPTAEKSTKAHKPPRYWRSKRWLIVAVFTAISVISYHLYKPQQVSLNDPVVSNQLRIYGYEGRADNNPDRKHLVVAEHGAVASTVPLCSEMAVEILKKGGSAVDAAITTALCIGSIYSMSSGIGGGGFMTVRHENGTATAFNFREMAPQDAHKHMFDDDAKKSQIGGLAIAIPGEVAGLKAAFDKYSSGNLTWKELFEPVIDVNLNGFEVNEVLATSFELAKEKLLHNREQWLWAFVADKGAADGYRLARTGDIIKRENYANTLRLIAERGADVFYDPNGPIVPALIDTIYKEGGIMKGDDFAKYTVLESEPIVADFLGKKIMTTPNPSSGPALVLGLHILSHFGSMKTAGNDLEDFGANETQVLIEAMKWMAAARTELGDYPKGNPRVDEIVTKEWAQKCIANISLDHTLPWQDYKPSYEQIENHGTAHLSVIDENGMAVSMTTTVNLLFGSMVCDPHTGIVLNDEMDDFSVPRTDNAFELRPSIYNYVKPLRRPLSSCVPSIVFTEDGGVEMIIGAAGGSHIVTAVLQAIIRKYQYDLPLLSTIALPRIHHQLLPEVATFEHGAPKQILEAIEEIGHKAEYDMAKTSMNGIYRDPDTGIIHAVSDFWRKRSEAAGY